MSRSPLLFASLAAVVVLTSCIGDPGSTQAVVLHNAADVPVVVFGGSERLTPVPDGELAPGETRSTGWFIGPGSVGHRTVHAYDAEGNLVFCRSYVFKEEDVQRTRIRVEIVKGQITC